NLQATPRLPLPTFPSLTTHLSTPSPLEPLLLSLPNPLLPTTPPTHLSTPSPLWAPLLYYLPSLPLHSRRPVLTAPSRPSPLTPPSPRGPQRSLRASLSDSSSVRTSPSRTGPFTLRMMERLAPPPLGPGAARPLTCVHCPCEPVRPSTLVTRASLMGCTRLVSMTAPLQL
uniref:Uncharacterized protein n=1 Tax=Naja naja TaxID=35670 RepID=A0A8C6VBC3_NAJNA